MIYHITTKAVWKLAEIAQVYEPESLVAEGFIHCSTEDQVLKVANFYYKDRDNLLLLEIDETRLEAPLKWEGEEEQKFPHIYGPMNVSAVVRVEPLVKNDQGEFMFPFTPIIH